MSTSTILATCSPFLPGYGFRAELRFVVLPSGREMYRLVSWDTPAGHKFGDPPAEMDGPTLRAECAVDDYRPGAMGDKSDAHLAVVLCQFWSAFALGGRAEWMDDPEDEEEYMGPANDHRRVAMDNAAWWDKWDGTGGGLTGECDGGNPDTWTCDTWQPEQGDGEEEG